MMHAVVQEDQELGPSRSLKLGKSGRDRIASTRVLILSFFTRWVTHLGTELELAQRHLDAGDEVTFLACDGVIGGCVANPAGDQDECVDCVLRRFDALKEVKGRAQLRYLKSYAPSMEAVAAHLPDDDTLEAYRTLEYRGTDLGWGALSSAVSVERDPGLDSPEARATMRRLLSAAITSFEAVDAFLASSERFDAVYIFNGRFASTRAGLRAAQLHGYEPLMHERGSSIHRFQLYHNKLPHHREARKERISEAWEGEPDEQKKRAIAVDFFEARRLAQPRSWKSFTADQQEGRLPSDWSPERRNIALFNSSEDEFVAIGDEWTNGLLYDAQVDGIERIVSEAAIRMPKAHFYVRMHPNLGTVDNADTRRLRRLEGQNLTVIPPESDVSSYALLDACDTVVTFGSTMGIEAAFWGKPSILAGNAAYEDVDAVYKANNHEEVMSLLVRGDLPPRDPAGALHYAFAMNRAGERFKYWNPVDFDAGRFRELWLTRRIVFRFKWHKRLLRPLLASLHAGGLGAILDSFFLKLHLLSRRLRGRDA